MIRKCLVFVCSAAILVSLGAGIALSRADEKETELGKIMEKVQTNYVGITKGVRTKVAFKKSQKDVEKQAKELMVLAKKARIHKEAVKNAKDVADPEKRWDQLFDALVDSSANLGKVVAKPTAKFEDARAAFKTVKGVCADCHRDFRIEDKENNF